MVCCATVETTGRFWWAHGRHHICCQTRRCQRFGN